MQILLLKGEEEDNVAGCLSSGEGPITCQVFNIGTEQRPAFVFQNLSSLLRVPDLHSHPPIEAVLGMSAQKVAASASRQINAVVVSAGLMEKTVKVRVGVQKWNNHIRKVRPLDFSHLFSSIFSRALCFILSP
jgi:hypothetical protein